MELDVNDHLEDACAKKMIKELAFRTLKAPEIDALQRLLSNVAEEALAEPAHCFRAELEAAWVLRDERAFYALLDRLDAIDNPALEAKAAQRRVQLYKEAMRNAQH